MTWRVLAVMGQPENGAGGFQAACFLFIVGYGVAHVENRYARF
nr:hypothetical protein [uncultured Kingella sp.]